MSVDTEELLPSHSYPNSTPIGIGAVTQLPVTKDGYSEDGRVNMIVLSPEQEPKTDATKLHSDLIETYIKRIQEAAQHDLSPEEIWEAVFMAELGDLKQALQDDSESSQSVELALNILITNLLATDDMLPLERQQLITQRMWEIAKSGMGTYIYKVADENMQICVLTHQPPDADQPEVEKYESVFSQIDPYLRVFQVTDPTDKLDSNLAPHILNTGTKEQIEWYLKTLFSQNKHGLIKCSLPYVAADLQKDMVLLLYSIGYDDIATFAKTRGKEDGIISASELIDLYMKDGNIKNIVRYIKSVEKEDFEKVLLYLINYPDALKEAIETTRYSDYRESLSLETIRTLHDLGVAVDPSFLRDKLTEDSLMWLLDAYSNEIYLVIPLLEMSSQTLQQLTVDTLLGKHPPDTTSIKCQIECFNKLDTIGLFTKLIEIDPGTTMINSDFEKLLNSFDKDIILKLITLFPDNTLSSKFTEFVLALPDCDTQWLADTLISTKHYISILINIEGFKDILDEEQIKKLLDPYAPDLLFIVVDFDKLTILVDTKWLTEYLIVHESYTTLFKNYQLLKDALTNQTIIDLISQHEYILDRVLAADALPESQLQEMAELYEKSQDFGPYFKIIASLGVSMKDVGPKVITYALSSSPALAAFLDNPTSIETITKYGVAEFTTLLITNNYYFALANVYALNNQDFKKLILTTLMENQLGYTLMDIVKANLESLPIPLGDIEIMMMQKGMELAVYDNFILFHETDPGNDSEPDGSKELQHSADEMIVLGMAPSVLLLLNSFPIDNRPSNEKVIEAIKQTINMGHTDVAIDSIGIVMFRNRGIKFPEEITGAYIRAGYIEKVMYYADSFATPTEPLVEETFRTDQVQAYSYYEQYLSFGNQPIPWVEKAIKVLDPEAPPSISLAIKDIYNNERANPDYLVELGVTSKGDDGANQLKQVIHSVRALLTDLLINGQDQSKMQLLINNFVAKAYAKRLIHFTDAEWGMKDEQAWQDILSHALDLTSEEIQLPDGFEQSGDITLATKDSEAVSAIKISVDARDQFTKLKDDVIDILGHIDDIESYLDDTIENLIAMLEDELETTESKIEEIDKPEHRKGLSIKIDKINRFIEATESESAESCIQNLPLIEGIKITQDGVNIEELKRKLLIASVLEAKDPNTIHFATALTQSGINNEGIAMMQNFIDKNITLAVTETLGISGKNILPIKKVLSTRPFSDYLDKTKEIGLTKTSTIRFVPTRGLLFDLSGHFSDACWATSSESITREYPNMTCLTFLRNQSKTSERIVGSCILIDTVDQETKEKVLIIRGLNPIQNYIMDVDMNQFLDQFFSYVRSIAGDRKVAIVLDDASGGALTNRPELHDLLITRLKPNAGDPLKLDIETTTFNDHELSPEKGYPVYTI